MISNSLVNNSPQLTDASSVSKIMKRTDIINAICQNKPLWSCRRAVTYKAAYQNIDEQIISWVKEI